MKKVFLFVLFVVLLVITRFWNLNKTGVFFWDQALELVRIHQYYQEKTFTLVGPISEDNKIVYSSLTDYMLMPFAVLGKFSQLSVTVGAAFWGFWAAMIIFFLIHWINGKIVWWAGLLLIVWFPLVESSRCFWNPYLMVFWLSLGLLFYQNRSSLAFFLTGLFFGLAGHNNYLAWIASGVFSILAIFKAFKERQYNRFLILAGFLVAVLPFVIFDWRHPPGLFLTRLIDFNNNRVFFDSIDFPGTAMVNIGKVLLSYVNFSTLAIVLGLLILVLLVFDLKQRSQSLVYLLSWIGQVVLVSLIKPVYPHYFLPGLVFFLCWLVYPRSKRGLKVSRVILAWLIFGSVLTIIPQLASGLYLNKAWQPNIITLERLTNQMEKMIRENSLRNVNLAVLGSTDPNTYGWKYRNLLLLKGIIIKDKHEYFNSEYLLVVTQSSEEKLRRDPALELNNFRDGEIVNRYQALDFGWRLFVFRKKEVDL